MRQMCLISKAKFLGQVKTHNRIDQIEFFNLATVKEQVRSVNIMLNKSLNDPSCYSIPELTQLIKELATIASSEQYDLIDFLRKDEGVLNILMVLLTREYQVVKPGQLKPQNCSDVWIAE